MQLIEKGRILANIMRRFFFFARNLLRQAQSADCAGTI
jgi:hypothetical protein